MHKKEINEPGNNSREEIAVDKVVDVNEFIRHVDIGYIWGEVMSISIS